MPYERWPGLLYWAKYMSLAAVSGAALLLIELFVMRPQQARISESALNARQARSQVAALRHNLLSLIASTKDAGQRMEAMPDTRFSVMELVRYAEGKLETWQPESRPAALEMLLTWEKLPALFAHLSGYRSLSLQGFSVEPAGERLQLILMLDVAGES